MKHRTIDPLLLLGSIVVLAALLTWIVPAGRFDRVTDPQTHRTVVVPGSYKPVEPHPVGPWGTVVAMPQGLVEAAEVVFYVLLAGGAMTVAEATGAFGNLLNHLVWRFGDRPLLVLGLTSILFVLGGGSNNMYEEILALIPLLCVLVKRLGLPPEMALGVSIGTASVAAVFSPFNTFTLGISQQMAQLPLFSGFGFRTCIFTSAMIVWFGYLAWYTVRYRRPEVVHAHEGTVSKWRARDIAVLAIFNLGMAVIVLGGVFQDWGLRQFGAVFVVMGLAAGLAGGLGWRGTSEQFAEGFRRMAVAASLVGFARAISVVLANGMILDTIANALFSPLRNFSLTVSAGLMVISESIIAFPMPSDSGRALMTLPIAIPLADLLGMSRQVVVLAYQYSGLISSLVTPTAGPLLAMCALAGMSFSRWLRFIAVPTLVLFLLALVAVAAGVKLNIR